MAAPTTINILIGDKTNPAYKQLPIKGDAVDSI